MKNKRGKKVLIFIACLIIVYFFALLGSIFTSSETNSAWYQSVKSNLTPPNWVFPIVWNILFLLIAISMFVAWTNSDAKKRRSLIMAYGINLIFNSIWSLLFFGLKNPLAAFFCLIAVWLSIILIMVKFSKIKKVFWLLLPYLLWVSFAGILNYLAI